MKKLQITLVMLLTFVTSFTFVSCGDDDDEELNSTIVGTWSETYEDDDDICTIAFLFNSDGTFVYTNKTLGDESETIIHNGTYEYYSSTNRLVLTVGTGVTYWSCKISGNTMYLVDERDGESLKLTKI